MFLHDSMSPLYWNRNLLQHFPRKPFLKIPSPNWKEAWANCPASGNANPRLHILLIHQCQRRFSPEGHRTTSKEPIFLFCPGCRTDCAEQQHFPNISQDGNLLAPLEVHLTFSCILNIQYFFGTKWEGFQQVCKTYVCLPK